MLESITAAANRPTLIAALVAALVALAIAILLNSMLKWHCQRTRPGLARTIYRLVVCRGRRLPGALTKLVLTLEQSCGFFLELGYFLCTQFQNIKPREGIKNR